MPDTESKAPRDLFRPAGATGLNISYGKVYEGSIKELQGDRWRRNILEMTSLDAVVGGINVAITMLVRRTNHRIIEGKGPGSADAAEFVEGCLDDMNPGFKPTLGEVLTMLPWGWSWLEMCLKHRVGPREADPAKRSKFSDGKIGWWKWEIRSQESLDEWDYDEETNEVKGLWQMPPPKYQRLYIPRDRSLHFRTTVTKGNPEGRSILMNAYRSWYFKRNIQNIEGIGIERDYAGIPIIKIPAGFLADDATPQEKNLVAAMRQLVTNIRRDEQEGVVFPLAYDKDGRELYKLELLNAGGTRQFDTDKVITRYNAEIAMTALADFLVLGHEKVGSFALASSKTDLFATAIGAYLDDIAAEINERAIPLLLELNGFDTENPPKLAFDDIETVDLAELAPYLTALNTIGVPLSDVGIRKYLLESAGIPVPEMGLADPKEPPVETAADRVPGAPPQLPPGGQPPPPNGLGPAPGAPPAPGLPPGGAPPNLVPFRPRAAGETDLDDEVASAIEFALERLLFRDTEGDRSYLDAITALEGGEGAAEDPFGPAGTSEPLSFANFKRDTHGRFAKVNTLGMGGKPVGSTAGGGAPNANIAQAVMAFAPGKAGPTGKKVKSIAEMAYLSHVASGKSQSEAAKEAGIPLGVGKGILKAHGGLGAVKGHVAAHVAGGAAPAPAPTPPHLAGLKTNYKEGDLGPSGKPLSLMGAKAVNLHNQGKDPIQIAAELNKGIPAGGGNVGPSGVALTLKNHGLTPHPTGGTAGPPLGPVPGQAPSAAYAKGGTGPNGKIITTDTEASILNKLKAGVDLSTAAKDHGLGGGEALDILNKHGGLGAVGKGPAAPGPAPFIGTATPNPAAAAFQVKVGNKTANGAEIMTESEAKFIAALKGGANTADAFKAAGITPSEAGVFAAKHGGFAFIKGVMPVGYTTPSGKTIDTEIEAVILNHVIKHGSAVGAADAVKAALGASPSVIAAGIPSVLAKHNINLDASGLAKFGGKKAGIPAVAPGGFDPGDAGPTGKKIKNQAESDYLTHLSLGKSQGEAAKLAGIPLGVAKGITKAHGGLPAIKAHGTGGTPTPTPAPAPAPAPAPTPPPAPKAAPLKAGDLSITGKATTSVEEAAFLNHLAAGHSIYEATSHANLNAAGLSGIGILAKHLPGNTVNESIAFLQGNLQVGHKTPSGSTVDNDLEAAVLNHVIKSGGLGGAKKVAEAMGADFSAGNPLAPIYAKHGITAVSDPNGAAKLAFGNKPLGYSGTLTPAPTPAPAPAPAPLTPWAQGLAGPTGKTIKSISEANYLAHLASGLSQPQAAAQAGIAIGVAKGITKVHGGLPAIQAHGKAAGPAGTAAPAPAPAPAPLHGPAVGYGKQFQINGGAFVKGPTGVTISNEMEAAILDAHAKGIKGAASLLIEAQKSHPFTDALNVIDTLNKHGLSAGGGGGPAKPMPIPPPGPTAGGAVHKPGVVYDMNALKAGQTDKGPTGVYISTPNEAHVLNAHAAGATDLTAIQGYLGNQGISLGSASASPKAIEAVLTKHGLTLAGPKTYQQGDLGPTGKPIGSPGVAQVLTLHAQGLTPTQIAAQLSFSKANVQSALMAHGQTGNAPGAAVPPPPPPGAGVTQVAPPVRQPPPGYVKPKVGVFGNKADVAPKVNFPPSLSDLSAPSALGGSTGATAHTWGGVGFVLKAGKSAGHAQSEHDANNVYRAAGISAPASQMYGDKMVTARIAGKPLSSLTGPELEAARAELRKGFALDVVLKNHDVIGLNSDNIIVSADGRVHRIDNGSSFNYRAQGGNKSYGPDTSAELEGMRNASKNATAAAVYGKLTMPEIHAQALALQAKKADLLAVTPAAHQAALSARIDDLVKRTMPTAGKAPWTTGGFLTTAKTGPQAAVTTPPSNTTYTNLKADYAWKANYNAMAASYTTKEKQAIGQYTSSGYSDLNKKLRSGENATLSAGQQQSAAALDAALHKQTIGKPAMLYRGFSLSQAEINEIIQPGKLFIDRAYSSSSVDPAHAFSGNIQFKIEAPADTRGAYVKSISSVSSEDEWILPRGTGYRINKVSVSPSGIHTVHVTVEGHGMDYT